MQKQSLKKSELKPLRTSVLLAVCSLMIFFTAQAALQAQEPAEIVEQKGKTVLQIIRATNFNNPDSVSNLRRSILGELKPAFDFREFTDRSLGVHANELSESQLNRLHKAFEEYLTSLYMDQFLRSEQLNSLERIRIVKQEIRGNTARVSTAVDLSTKDKPITVEFIFYKKGDQWIAFNFESEGYSLLSSYRSQFNNILSRNSFERLVELIENKTK